MKFGLLAKMGAMVPLIAIAMALLTAWFMMRPAFGSIAATQLRIENLKVEVADKTDQVAILKNFSKEGSALAQQISLLSVAAPEKGQIPELLIMVQAMASRSGLTFINASPTPSGANTRVEIAMKGDYAGLVNFLDTLNRNVRPGFVKSFSFISQPSLEGTGQQAAASTVNVVVEFIGGGAQ